MKLNPTDPINISGNAASLGWLTSRIVASGSTTRMKSGRFSKRLRNFASDSRKARSALLRSVMSWMIPSNCTTLPAASRNGRP